MGRTRSRKISNVTNILTVILIFLELQENLSQPQISADFVTSSEMHCAPKKKSLPPALFDGQVYLVDSENVNPNRIARAFYI